MLGMAVAVVASMGSITWKSTSLNLGQVKKNQVREISFEFKNDAKQEVKILEAKGSCGCTQITYPEGPIKAGETASIKAKYRSGKVGIFKKNIRITSSLSETPIFLHFSGEVVE